MKPDASSAQHLALFILGVAIVLIDNRYRLL